MVNPPPPFVPKKYRNKAGSRMQGKRRQWMQVVDGGQRDMEGKRPRAKNDEQNSLKLMLTR